MPSMKNIKATIGKDHPAAILPGIPEQINKSPFGNNLLPRATRSAELTAIIEYHPLEPPRLEIDWHTPAKPFLLQMEAYVAVSIGYSVVVDNDGVE